MLFYYDQYPPFHSNPSNSTTELSASFPGIASLPTSPPRIFLDMDGVLVDFEKGVHQLLHTGTSNIDKQLMWKNIAQSPNWFERLEWKQDGRRLWRSLKHLRPDILTGVPDIKTSCTEKYNWCKRELGLNEAIHVDMAADGANNGHQSVNGNVPKEDTTNVITCWSNNKYKECTQGS
jgi:hypothetical protein